MRIFVTGASGQVGGEMSRAFAGDEIIPGMRPAFDLTDWSTVRRAVEDARPDVVVHLGAYSDVDGCEGDPDRAYRTNALGTRYVALAAKLAGSDLVVVSSDYVFDGEKGEPYLEWDEPHPLSVYGRSKLAGEREAIQLHDRCYVVRASWVYSPRGRNFIRTMLRLGRERPEIAVVDDERGSPTLAGDLADALRRLVASRAYGIYHFSNAGVCSRYDLASRAVQRAGLPGRVVPISTRDFLMWNPLPARRPAFSALRNVAGAAIGIELPAWEVSLDRLVDQLGPAQS